ncbi:MAG: cupin domain-containing protein [Thermoleophilia bacterium]
MESGVSVTSLDHDAPERFTSLRRALGVTSFGINHMVLRPGERGRIHVHAEQEEVYIVLQGTLTVQLDDGARDVAAGELMRVAPDVRRQVVNLGPGVVSVVALGGMGEHNGRDATAYRGWDDHEGGTPQEVPLPDDLPASELRS